MIAMARKKVNLTLWQKAEKLFVAVGGEINYVMLRRAARVKKREISSEKSESLLRQLCKLGLILPTKNGYYKQNILPFLLKKPTLKLPELDP